MWWRFFDRDIFRQFGPPLAFGVLLYLLFFSAIRDLLGAIFSYFGIYYQSPYFGLFFSFASGLVILFLGSVFISLGTRLAASLGFQSGGGSPGIQVSGTGNVFHIQRPDEEDGEPSEKAASEIQFTYDKSNPLSGLQIARNRLGSHVISLRNTSILNLFSGIVIAIIGIYVLSLIFNDLEKYAQPNSSAVEPSRFIAFTLLPRLSVALFIQVFAYFFLLMYRSNLADVRYFQNEMTNLDLYATATIIATKEKTTANEKIALQQLFKIERNRVIGKNQKVINSAEDSELIEKIIRSTDFLSKLAGQPSTRKEKRD